MNTPTDAAMRAAKAVGDSLWRGDDSDSTFALIIDRETHLPQIMDALTVAMLQLTALDARQALKRINEILNPTQKHSQQTQENIANENTDSSSGEHHPATKAA